MPKVYPCCALQACLGHPFRLEPFGAVDIFEDLNFLQLLPLPALKVRWTPEEEEEEGVGDGDVDYYDERAV